MAVISGALAPLAGRLLDRVDPRLILVPGLGVVAAALVLNVVLVAGGADTPIWLFLIPSALQGIGNAGMWGPLATTATRNLPPHLAGAGSGIYNTTRTVGSVIGSAAIAALMQARLTANLPALEGGSGGFGDGALPPFIVPGFSTAMAESLWLPVAATVIGVVAVLFMRRPGFLPERGGSPSSGR